MLETTVTKIEYCKYTKTEYRSTILFDDCIYRA